MGFCNHFDNIILNTDSRQTSELLKMINSSPSLWNNTHNKFVCVCVYVCAHGREMEREITLKEGREPVPEQKGMYQEGKNSRSWEDTPEMAHLPSQLFLLPLSALSPTPNSQHLPASLLPPRKMQS